jgi:uncharacterized GH25 family protein
MVKYIVAVVTLLVVSSVAQAHYVWVERDGTGSARTYFGEWQEDLHEKTGGLLDRIKSPRAFLTDSSKLLPIERKEDYRAISVTGPGDVRLAEDSLAPREDKREGGKSKAIFYAKAGRSETKAVLDLELVPVAAESDTLILVLRGVPLAKTEVTVFGPSKWQKTFYTDEQGRVTVETPWAGRYVVQVTHLEQKAGEAGGEKFDRLRYVSTLSFVVQQGIAWTK